MLLVVSQSVQSFMVCSLLLVMRKLYGSFVNQQQCILKLGVKKKRKVIQVGMWLEIWCSTHMPWLLPFMTLETVDCLDFSWRGFLTKAFFLFTSCCFKSSWIVLRSETSWGVVYSGHFQRVIIMNLTGWSLNFILYDIRLGPAKPGTTVGLGWSASFGSGLCFSSAVRTIHPRPEACLRIIRSWETFYNLLVHPFGSSVIANYAIEHQGKLNTFVLL